MNLSAVKTAMADLYAAVAAPAQPGSDSAGSLDADTLLTVVEDAQRVINIAGGIQAHAIAHLAAHDEVRDDEQESGWTWRRHNLGFTAEDTASLVAPCLGVSVPVAQGRVEDAVHQVSVTPRLVDVMGSGELDVFRAHLVTREVMPCSDEIAREIVDRLIEHFRRTGRWSETAGPLASRTRRLVARLAPDVAAATKVKAVTDRALTRRPISEAADLWNGLVPVEQSLVMWQAIDHLARDLKRANPDLTLDQARLDAMQQLILGQADVTIHLHATHAEVEHESAGDSGEDHSAHEATASAAPSPHQTRSGLAERAVRGVVELGGLNRPGTTVVDLDRLPSCVRLVPSTPLGCHPGTGALTSGVVPRALAPCDLAPPPPGTIEDRYRPSPALQRLVRLRDGHCRFPGCQIAARSCDLDHVMAWPAGPTAARNLMCLCRRHHRIKQRPGWSVRLEPDGIAHWTDPTGRITETEPIDHLDRVHHPVMPHTQRRPTAEPSRREPSSVDPSRPSSTRERMTRERLSALLLSHDATPDTLAELTLARLLHIAQSDTVPAPLIRIDWRDGLVAELVGPALCRDAAPARPDKPAKESEPPPF
ncbi:HNH endonuclease signature motif containing protein [Knoellia sp. Soil729]|uniref:HNH endonuclease signature motif containing protein n=1 Tax=Knoellia sp. Soil729 TaxID=1736394 RepID=UPI0006FC215E|nr:HNH endonuclease signature motif containing protein [Knoellia sp. Soil729]KRE43706.1 hypothetical protein ASG74_02360 [Knoellia sp. Soil729]